MTFTMKYTAALLLLILATVSALGAESRPNVLFILADDLGWADTTLYGHTKFYNTPNIERLAKRGMTFTHAYSASPLCSPTRSAVLTGLSPARTGITAPNCHLPQVILQATVKGGAAPTQKVISPSVVTRLKTDYPTLSKSLEAHPHLPRRREWRASLSAIQPARRPRRENQPCRTEARTRRGTGRTDRKISR